VPWFFLLSGLFMGWSLGANDAASIFGTAVGTRMLRFRTAALVASIFVVLGAVIGGAGTTHTLGKLGSVNALAGSFTVALAAGLSVAWMVRLHLPVSTSQAIVGAIVGWNIFTGVPTDLSSLATIMSTWVVCPMLAALFSMVLFTLARRWSSSTRTHLLAIHSRTRWGLLVVGAMGAWALGANNIANVVGVFVPAFQLKPATFLPGIRLDSAQQLFLLGSLAISVGIFTYSRHTMQTVGHDIFRLTPVAALVVVVSEALVLYLFASESLEHLLAAHGLPTLPLVPVSASQAVVGGVLGIGLSKGARGVNLKLLRGIAGGWIITPIAAAAVCYVSLFFVQNVFEQEVVRPVHYEISGEVIQHLEELGVNTSRLSDLQGREFDSARDFRVALFAIMGLRAEGSMHGIFAAARIHETFISSTRARDYFSSHELSTEEFAGIIALEGRRYRHDWQLDRDLAKVSAAWRPHTGRGAAVLNKGLRRKLARVHRAFQVTSSEDEIFPEE